MIRQDERDAQHPTVDPVEFERSLGGIEGASESVVPPPVPDDPSGVLDPADLSLDTDHSRDLGDGRLVVSVADDGTASARPLGLPGDADTAERFADVTEQFAADVAVKTDHGVATHEVRTDDVREAFGDLVRWYAARIAPEEDPREVVELLLSSGALDG